MVRSTLRNGFTVAAISMAALLGMGLPSFGWAQPGRDPAEAVRIMLEQMGKQLQEHSGQFMPGMFGELSPEQMAEIEKVAVSAREEAQFGNHVLKSYEASLRGQNQKLTRQGNDVKYLSALVDNLRPQMANARRYPQIDVALVQSSAIDAYSIPGGHLIFTSGLMSNVQSEAELVGVIAHELSHLDRGHQLLTLKQSKRLGQVTDVRTGMLWISTMAKPFRPEFESQADLDAVGWMLGAGYDPRQLAQLLSRWDARQDKNAPEWTKMLPSFVRSHPDSGRRAQIILQEFQRSGLDPRQLITGQVNLERRLPATGRQLRP